MTSGTTTDATDELTRLRRFAGWERVASPGHIVVYERDDEHTHSKLTYHRRDKDVSIRVTEKSDDSYGFVSTDFAGLLSVLNAVRLAVVEVATPTPEAHDGDE